jgi:glycosyltransferase involved in cell wall biosynthesis
VKILQLINTLSAGGAELHLLTLCRFLRKQNVEIVVACLREEVKDSRSLRADFEKEGIKTIILNASSRYDHRFFAQIARVVRLERPNVLHTHLPRADLAGAFARFLNPSIGWVSSVHAIYSEDWSGRWTLPFFNLLWRRADVMLCISHAVRDWLVARGVPSVKARVIHYGIEPEKFVEARVNLRDQWGLNGHPIIGSIGRLEPRKNHECLIAAMPKICTVVPNALLLIAGHDPWGHGARLQQQVDDLGLGKNVRLLGFQNDIASFLKAIDVFAFATNSEGFGQVIVEAMAMAKPVVASKVPPLTEIVVDGETGLLVDLDPKAFAPSLIQLLMEPSKRAQMGERGRERVSECFTAERMCQQTILLYEELLQRRSALKSIA